MRSRPSSRLLIVNPDNAVLLFRFVFVEGALEGEDYWATPGGGLEEDETFEEAAVRECFEETGIRIADPGPEIARREFNLRLSDGEQVVADERFFLIRHSSSILSREGWTAEEARVVAECKWWSRDELAQTLAPVFPEDLLTLLPSAS